MGDKINKEFEDFQKELEIREKHLKPIIHFKPHENWDEILKELKDKKIDL